ncbi:MAG TPA: diacylglycerol kinase family protein, partial [Gammaproteobacteria bacterium]|nr:diacylglycerol kinase family protein [Gammaproteobacteria bacterium]
FARVQALVAGQPAIHHIVTRCPADIAPALEVLSGRQVKVLAINGGDGTAAAILGQMLEHAVFERPPLIALLPGGTANMNAGDIGIRGRLIPATQRFCRWCEDRQDVHDSIVERPLLRVRTGDAARYGMFLGAGAVMQGTEYTHREIHARGLRDEMSLALGTARTIWGVVRGDPRFARSVSMDLRVDDTGEPATHDVLILAISTLHRLFFGMRPFWGTGPGRLRMTLVEQHCTRFLRTFISIARGRPNRNAVPQSGYLSRNADRIRLSMDGDLNLDGEIIHACGEISIETTGSLRFLRL